ncbi:U3 small nucleolar RNA-associated protein 6-domain-containing protein [Lipomyces orientalis]|uniref:U3 small nucleolar RNA-associated protein 6-domain-containing protein n=1 Tax=Lipomyces orientalis TaxID=1233043 RepID=A0ACC3TTA8_9ASCO
MAEKVRYYLEQTLPELEDLQRKGIFTKPEIASITRRRTDFEHRIHGRGAKLLDFLKYAEFEMNLDLLRKKRIQRLGGGQPDKVTTSVSTWSGQQRIFFIFDRATGKFKGDLSLWKQYISYARQQKARHLLNKIFRNVVRLHPAKPELWVLAAEHELRENANRKAARNLVLRGLKFNPSSKELADAYVKLEEDVKRAVDELQAKTKQDAELGQDDSESDDVDHESGAEPSDDGERETEDGDD